MSERHKFIFEGMPVRGQLVRLGAPWQELLARRAANTETGPYPPAVARLLGEMTAAAVLMHGTIKFDGALVMQIQGDGPVKLAVAEVRADLGLRATATCAGPVAEGSTLAELVNAHGQGRCAVTLDPRQRQPGQQAYQGVVPLADAAGAPVRSVAGMLEHYLRQSEQLDTILMLAADDRCAAGLLLQRMPLEGARNLGAAPAPGEDDFQRLSVLARSLKADELLGLAGADILRRLFWDEPLLALEAGAQRPRFACTCSRARVAAMLAGLGQAELQSILDERGLVEVGCDFCGRQERFDAIDVARLFTPLERQSGPSARVQ